MESVQERTRLYARALQELESCLNLVVKNVEGDECEDCKEELEQIYTSYKRLQDDWVLENNAFCVVKDEINKTTDCRNFDVASRLEHYRKKCKKTPRKKKDIKSMFNDFSKQDGGVNTQGHSSISIIDPITKKKMTNPVRNIYCNHSYDFESIKALLKNTKNGEIRCPYQGCVNNQPIVMNDLIPDEVILGELKRLSLNCNSDD